MSIVAGTKFITYNPNLDLKERRSKGPNSETRVYTIEDIVTAAATSQTLQQTVDVGNVISGNAGTQTQTVYYNINRFDNTTAGTFGIYGLGSFNISDGVNAQNVELPTSLSGSIKTITFPNADGVVALTNTLSTEMSYAASDAITPLTVSDAGIMFATHDMTIQSVFGAIGIVGGTSGVTTIDIKKNGVSILSTLITVDFGEATSLTAAIQPVVSVSSILKGDKISANITTISGDGTEAGLQITLNGLRV